MEQRHPPVYPVSARHPKVVLRPKLTQISGQRGSQVKLLVSSRVRQPFAFALDRPVIVLPDDLCGDDRAMRWSLAHEWTHIERHDFRAWLTAGLARVLFFYHPLVWWLRRQLRLCQDFLADDQAARQTPQPEDYAEFLTVSAAAGSLRPALAGLGMGSCKSELYRRVVMLVQNRPMESRAPRLWTISVTCAALVLVSVAAAFSVVPQAPAQGESPGAKHELMSVHSEPAETANDRQVVQGEQERPNSYTALNGVYAELQPLFKEYFPTAQCLNRGRDGLRFEYNVTTYEFPYTGPQGKKHEATTQRGPKAGGILCSVSLEKGPYRGQLGLIPRGDHQYEPMTLDKHEFKQLLMAPYSAKDDLHLWVSIAYPSGTSPEFLKRFVTVIEAFENEPDTRNDAHKLILGATEKQQLPPEAKVTRDENGNIRSIALRGHSTTDKVTISRKMIQQIASISTLEWLDLSFSNASDDVLEPLKRLRSLKGLDLSLSNATGKTITTVSKLPNLLSLRMEKCKVNDDDLKALADMPQLVNLYLGGTQVTDDGLPSIGKLSELVVLDLRDCAITDKGLRSMGHFKQIQNLWLSKTIRYGENDRSQLTDASVEYLSTLKTLVELQIADSQLTDGGLSRLRKALPKANIDTTRTGTTYLLSGQPNGDQAGPVARSQPQPEESERRPLKNAKVSGKVIDEGGKPVAGADVWLPLVFRGVGHIHTLHARSDAQGRFTLEVAPDWLVKMQPWDRAMTVWAYTTGHQLGTGRVTFPDGASEMVIRLGPATDTSFVVLDPEGQPCAGALVEPYYIRTWQGHQFLPDELLARIGTHTDNEGRAKLPAVPPDLLYQVRVATNDFGIQFQRMIEAPAIVGKTIRLRPAGKIEGRVIANQPEIAGGIRLIFTSNEYSGGSPPTEGYADVKSDEQGRFVIPAIAVGNVRIDAFVDEEQPLRPKLPRSLSVQADRTTSLEIPIVPTVVVRGSVRVKDTGKPVPGALIHIYYGVGRQGADPVSDEQGNYTARVLPGSVRLQVISMPKGYAWLHGNAYPFPSYQIPEDAKQFDLPPVEVEPTKSIPGRVVDQRGEPVGNIWISVVDGDRHYGRGKADKNGHFDVAGVPVTINPAHVKYVWLPEVGPGRPFVSTMPSECEILKTDPLILRALPRVSREDQP
jgi:hypothetical protein